MDEQDLKVNVSVREFLWLLDVFVLPNFIFFRIILLFQLKSTLHPYLTPLSLTNETSLTTVNLQQTFEGDVQELNLDFTIVSEELGQNTVEDLKPNGSETPVTNDNRIEYIHLVADYKLNRQIRTQCNAFR